MCHQQGDAPSLIKNFLRVPAAQMELIFKIKEKIETENKIK